MARPRRGETADDGNCRGDPDSGAEQRENDEQARRKRGRSDVKLWPHQDRRFAGEHVADDAADARCHDAHRKRRHGSNPIAERLCGAVGCISGKAGGIEPQQRLAREPMPAGDPDDKRGGDADESVALVCTQNTGAPINRSRNVPPPTPVTTAKKMNVTNVCRFSAASKRAGDSEDGDAEIIEEDERGWVHRFNGLH